MLASDFEVCVIVLGIFFLCYFCRKAVTHHLFKHLRLFSHFKNTKTETVGGKQREKIIHAS